MIFYLNMLGTSITIFFGVLAVIQPLTYAKAVSLIASKSQGITEIRATNGGLLLGLSIYAVICQHEFVFNCLGYGWLAVAIIRTISMFLLDKSFSRLSFSYVVLEVVVATMLLV